MNEIEITLLVLNKYLHFDQHLYLFQKIIIPKLISQSLYDYNIERDIRKLSLHKFVSLRKSKILIEFNDRYNFRILFPYAYMNVYLDTRLVS